MFTSPLSGRTQRRGIVLVLVLGMLGLMALIGVTFATFAGQSMINSRNFAQGVGRPAADTLMDYALAQLINDTNNPLSAIRGHSLLRDMYGNDSVFRGENPSINPAVETGGLLTALPYGLGYVTPQFLKYQVNSNSGTPFYNQLQFQTNIPLNGQYYGLDFTRWIIRVRSTNNGNFNFANQTFEILEDYQDTTNNCHWFTLANNLSNPVTDPATGNVTASDTQTFVYTDPNSNYANPYTSTGSIETPTTPMTPPYTFQKLPAVLSRELGGGTFPVAFALDGRYMRAFNGPGVTQPVTTASDVYPFNLAAYGNFRVTGLNPDSQGMDEDYDACDLENWYLGLQSADGQVVIPSFHRPGILTAADWAAGATAQRAKILRPRQVDNSPLFPTDPSSPVNGQLKYDIDNDGDGVTDSVWLDLGYPVSRDPSGKLYKPLFAFMILGLNGRLPLNTAGNLQSRAVGDQSGAPVPASGSPSTLIVSSGQVPYPGYYSPGSGTFPTNPMTPPTGNFYPGFSSQTYFDAPTWDHASHLGYSVNEINPKFALQNAPSNVFPLANGTYTPYGDSTSSNFSQFDNAAVGVALTQLRNILAGTVPITDALTQPYTGTVPVSNAASAPSNNYDFNIVTVNGQNWILPNGVADLQDYNAANVPAIQRLLTAVPGRWGEGSGVPKVLGPPSTVVGYSGLSFPPYYYSNPVRAGRSLYLHNGAFNGSNDAMDDDFDGLDPVLVQYASASYYYNEPGTTPTTVTLPSFSRGVPEAADTFDTIGQRAVPSERTRMFVTPHDPVGVGRVVDFMNRPNNDSDYGRGYDARGRTSFFRYFRTPGMPQEIRYPYGGAGSTYSTPYASSFYSTVDPNSVTAGVIGQRFLMPQLFPAGYSTAATQITSYASDIHNNRYHGYQSMLTPEVGPGGVGPSPQTIATMGAMPFDWDARLMPGQDPTKPTIPQGYPNDINTAAQIGMSNFMYCVDLFVPTINPTLNTLSSAVNTENGPNLGVIGNPAVLTEATPQATNPYPIFYGQTYTVGPNSIDGTTGNIATGAPVVNGYLDGSLNKDEADEMNLYNPNRFDQPFGPSDLEWLYRLQDVDGSTLTSRLSQLAPISFLNPADGIYRRRMFSTDAWDLISFSYANDNPAPYAGVLGNPGFAGGQINVNGNYSTDHDYTYNSRFVSTASPSLEIMNQAYQTDGTNLYTVMGNPITTEYLPNPTLPTLSPSYAMSYSELIPNVGYAKKPINPLPNQAGAASVLQKIPASIQYGVVSTISGNTMVQVQTPSIAHRDRRINLNFPLPISHDPAEPVRQKWCRETYQMLKAILPPAAVDTPEELAALSQFVVNIVDFRDPDPTMTRFVNTDLVVTDVLTRTASNVQPTATGSTLDQTWNVSPAGVRFATSADAANFQYQYAGNTYYHSPYDPSIYSPDSTTPFLIQHGMEYSPIAINEVLGFAAPYGSSTVGTLSNRVKGLMIELVNTLTEEQNNNQSTNNASAINLAGWDIVMTPDAYGWGRPDPISGDVTSIAYPPQIPPPATAMPGTPASPPPPNANAPLSVVQQANLTGTIRAINNGTPQYFVVGKTTPGSSLISSTNGTTYTGNYNFPTQQTLPGSFTLPTPTVGAGNYYWLYLRRPANPFDTAALTPQRPNREMVVVDAIRFPFIDAGNATTSGTLKTATAAGTDKVSAKAPNTVYSARRLQPYRGGHLVPPATPLNNPSTDAPTTGAASGVKTICPPSPAWAYGYSEQTSPQAAGTGTRVYGEYTDSNGQNNQAQDTTTPAFQQSIGSEGSPKDAAWANVPFLDRDFSSVAELLMVPGCPPGLFTKQFVEEPYPGNVVSEIFTVTQTQPSGNIVAGPPATVTDPTKVMTTTTVTYGGTTPTYATGSDDTYLTGTITPPTISTTTAAAPTTNSGTTTATATINTFPVGGRTDFGEIVVPTVAGFVPQAAITPVPPTFPYLPDNFYYTAASVDPPSGKAPASYTHLITEIGGWTGNGWHKMMEFFEVPSSANGSIGTADGGDNFDWQRADLKPGQVNINLIIDPEVFAGVFDDPRLNERLAAYQAPGNTTLPQIVTQIDGNGYAAASYPISGVVSSNILNVPLDTGAFNATQGTHFLGRGYVVRDPDIQNYTAAIQANATTGSPFPVQQLHGLSAAFSDFLKLRHGGSGFLFAHGGGPTGSGNVAAYTLNTPNGAVVVPYGGAVAGTPGKPSEPIAADRPYRSLSYPDINYTIMRPASLPPSPLINANNSYVSGTAANGGTFYAPGTVPPLPAPLALLSAYQVSTNNYIQLNPAVAPMNDTTNGPYQYVYDPGIKNPYLSIQYINQTAPTTQENLSPPSTANLPATSPPTPAYAPFPPPIPPTPAARLLQVPDIDTSTPTVSGTPSFPSSNASVLGQNDGSGSAYPYSVNQRVATPMLYTGTVSPPTLVLPTRATFMADNTTPQPSTTYYSTAAAAWVVAAANNYLGAGRQSNAGTGQPPTNDYRQHPLYRTELLQKMMNLTTVRTHQFACWITVGFFEVIRAGTPELGIPDVLGQELGQAAGTNLRYRSFFVLDRTKATGFNPYNPGDFRPVVTYRRRIE